MFSLSNAQVKLDNVNPRAELHGEDHALAVDIKLSTAISNDRLAEFDANLKSALYWKGNETQGELIAEPGHLPTLRFPEMGPIRWNKDLAGYTLTVHVGFSDESAIKIADCAVDKFLFDAQEGGSVIVSFRIQAHPDAATLGRLCELIQQDIEMTLTEPQVGSESDEKDEQGQGKLVVEEVE